MIDIVGLSREERLGLLERIWDSLNEEHEKLPVPEWKLALVEERIADYRRNPTPLRSAFEHLDELERRRR